MSRTRAPRKIAALLLLPALLLCCSVSPVGTAEVRGIALPATPDLAPDAPETAAAPAPPPHADSVDADSAAVDSVEPAPEATAAAPVRAPDRAVAPRRSAPAPEPVPAASACRFDPTLEAKILALTNETRVARGKTELPVREDLAAVARRHAEDMARRCYFSHFSPEGTDPGERAERGGVAFLAFAENLARIRESDRPDTLALRGWLQSPAHRRNLLDEGDVGYTATGIGVAIAPDGAVLVAQVFLR